jgi:nucleotide-binding universal stress UspA family protein
MAGSPARSARVVVGVGESLAALEALRYAVAEARRRGSVLCAVRVDQYGVSRRGHGQDLYPAWLAEHAPRVIRRAFDQAMGGPPHDLKVELTIVEGAVATMLVAQASNEADLLVVGASVRGRWAAAFSTVDRHCVRLALCPVVVVPPPALARTHGTSALRRAIRREAERYVEAGSSG